ncbi:CDP-diacylglycerol--serine O-phosphatidyltransferase [Aerobium aerolatum]|uniref:CDP-diacylglycerol--serine O-phosphatidyltransferase n=1 Tax=Aquamicrobium aerolatum DSM 21857 TaxID=1121003 RepID=A0A1I3N6D1_9HYPH|nr:CDP-diacylglycerol--serine O-phosphatidyltransferase [Aquamicrobium aerolatum]SFJ04823.1 CDP-diacylglycerol---serine O-phosphatidyltransferase [Aquamicrobium aerolatum DSM 21857]
MAPRSSPEANAPRRRKSRLREIPIRLIAPNLITVLAMCAGLSGIRLAFEHRFELAVAMVLTAALLDALDGRVARMLKATSRFGAEMDSLADIVNFGVAPGLVLYAYLLDQAGSFGWAAALLFAIACCLRLARFNVMLDDPDRPAWKSDYFVGVPAPAGALLVMLPVYLGFLGLPITQTFAFIASGFAVVIALLMVSRLPVYSGKSGDARIRRDMVMPLILGIVAYVVLLFSYTWHTMAFTALAYIALLPFGARAYFRREALSQGEAGQNSATTTE